MFDCIYIFEFQGYCNMKYRYQEGRRNWKRTRYIWSTSVSSYAIRKTQNI